MQREIELTEKEEWIRTFGGGGSMKGKDETPGAREPGMYGYGGLHFGCFKIPAGKYLPLFSLSSLLCCFYPHQSCHLPFTLVTWRKNYIKWLFHDST